MSLTLKVSFNSLISSKRTEGLGILHREGKLKRDMLIKLASFLGTQGLDGLDHFIRSDFPIVDILWVQEDTKNNYQGEGNLPPLEGEVEYNAPLDWWIGVVPPSYIIEAVKELYYPFSEFSPRTANKLQKEQLEDYKEVLISLLELVEDYNQESIKEELEEVEYLLEPTEETGYGSIIWPERLKDW